LPLTVSGRGVACGVSGREWENGTSYSPVSGIGAERELPICSIGCKISGGREEGYGRIGGAWGRLKGVGGGDRGRERVMFAVGKEIK